MPHRLAFILAPFLAMLMGVSALAQSSAARSPELTKLRFKAAKGNAIAQYNLGLAYMSGENQDLAEAYVWLSIASESGSTGLSLQTLVEEMTPAQLTEGKRRLAVYRVARPRTVTVSTDQSAVFGPGGRSDTAAPGGLSAQPVGLPGSNPTTSPNTRGAATGPVTELTTRNNLNRDLTRARRDINLLSTKLGAALTARDEANTKLAENTKELEGLRTTVVKLQQQQAIDYTGAKEITSLQSELAQLKKASTALGIRNQELEDAAALRGRTLDKTKAALAQANTRLETLNHIQQELQNAIAARDTAVSDRASISAELTTTRRELALAQNNTAIAQAAAAAPDAATKQQIAALTNQINVLDASLGEARSAQKAAADRLAELSHDLDSAHAELAQSKSLNQSQQEQSAEVQAELALAWKETDLLKKDISDAQAVRDATVADRDEAVSDRNSIVASLTTTRQELAEAQSTVAAMQRKLQAEQANANNQQSELKRTKDEVASLQQQLTAAQTAATTPDPAATQQISTLTNRITALQAHLKETRAEQTNTAERLAELSRDLDEARVELARSKSLNESHSEQDTKAQSELAQAKKDAAQLKQILAEAQTARHTAIANLNKTNNQLTALRATVTKLQREQSARESKEVKALKNELAALKTASATLESTNQELVDAAANNRRNLDATEAKLGQTTTQIAALTQSQSELRKTLIASDAAQAAAISDRDRIAAALTAASQDLAEIQGTVATTQHNLQEARAKAISQQLKIQQSQNEITSLQQQLQTAQAAGSDREKLAAELITTQQELSVAHNTIATIQSTLQEAQTDTNNQKRELKQFENEVVSLQQQLTAARAAAAAPDPAATQHIAALTHQISELNSQLSSAQTDQADAAKKLAELSRTLEATQADLTHSKSLNKSQLAQISTAQKELSAGANELAALRVTVAKLNDKKAAAASTEIISLQDQFQRLLDEAQTLGANNQALEESANDSGQRLEETRTWLAEANARIAELIQIEGNLRAALADRSSAAPDPAITAKITTLTSELTVANAAAANAQQQIAQQQTRLELQEQQLTALQSELTDDKSNLVDNENLISTLQANLAAAQATAAEPDKDSIARINTLNDEITALNLALSSSQSAMADATDRSAAALIARDAAAAGLNDRTNELTALRATVAKLQSEQTELNDADENFSKLQTEFEQLKTVATALGVQNQKLEDEAALRGRTLDETKATLAQANANLEAVSQNKDERQTAIAARDAAMADRASMTAALTATRQELAMAQDTITTTQRNLQEERANSNIRQQEAKRTQDEISSLQQQLTAAQATATTPDPAVAPQIAALESQLTLEKTARSEATAQLDSLSTDLGATRVQVAQLKMANDDLNNRLSTATQPIVSDPADTAKITALQSDLQQTRERLAQAQSIPPVSEDSTKQLSELHERIDVLNADLALEKAARSDADTQTQSLLAELESIQGKLTDTEALLATQAKEAEPVVDEAEIAAMQSKLETALSSYSRLESEHDSLKVSTDQLSERVVSLESQLASANTSNTDLARQLSGSTAIAAQVDPLREQLRQTVDQLTTTRRENAQLRTRLAIVAPPRSGTLSAPTRPGSTKAATVIARAAPTQPASTPAVTRPQSHTVVAGDTLSKISLHYYGTSQRWPEIFEANRATLPNERFLRIGMQIIIP